MSRGFAYLQNLNLNQLCDRYEQAEKYDDFVLQMRIMEECENREYGE